MSEKEALKALTYTPASLLGAADLVGSVKKNMIANLLITSGNIFSDDCVIYENWVQGTPYRLIDMRIKDIRGTYTLIIDTLKYKLALAGTFDKPTIKLTLDSAELRGATISLEKDIVSINFERNKTRLRLSGYLSGKDLEGKGLLDNGKWISWKATYIGPATEAEARQRRQTPVPESGKIIYPFTAYGSDELPKQEDVLFKNATVWTSETEGKLLNTDVLVIKGKISKIGKNLSAAEGIRVIDATGMHLTPGIIDEHSHIALAATNEMGQAITSKVRASDVMDPEDLTIYRQLAGGVTTAHILHGSANPVGGQSIIIKHRWGHLLRS